MLKIIIMTVAALNAKESFVEIPSHRVVFWRYLSPGITWQAVDQFFGSTHVSDLLTFLVQPSTYTDALFVEEKNLTPRGKEFIYPYARLQSTGTISQRPRQKCCLSRDAVIIPIIIIINQKQTCGIESMQNLPKRSFSDHIHRETLFLENTKLPANCEEKEGGQG